MPDIPEEAVHAAWWPIASHSTRWQYIREQDVREILEAAAPILAAQVRRETLRDVVEGTVSFEENAAAQGITGPQRIEDLQASEPISNHEADAFIAAMNEPTCCERVQRDVAEQIAVAVEDACPEPDTPHVGDHCDYREAARIARQIGEAP